MQNSEIINYQPKANCLDGRIIVVTGAGSGIGKEAALAFARNGATVILLGKTLTKLEAVYDQIETENLPQAAIFPINFESAVDQDYKSLTDALEEEFGHLDGLLHNAGELGPRTPITNYSSSEWLKVIAVNTTAPFILSKYLLPLLQKSQDGRIVFTSSTVGRKGRAYWGGYAVSKGAVETLMQVLADELEQTKVRVNSLNPGGCRTAMRATAYPAESPEDVPHPQTLMNRYIYLMGPDSLNLHGQQLDAQIK